MATLLANEINTTEGNIIYNVRAQQHRSKLCFLYAGYLKTFFWDVDE